MTPTKPTIPEVKPLVEALYSGETPCSRGSGIVGGHLHIVLDDGNFEKDHTEFCLDEARKDNCHTCIRIAELLLKMSNTQRKKLSRL